MSSDNDIVPIILFFVGLAAVITLAIVAIPVALVGGGLLLGGLAYYHHPRRKERIAKEHTEALYQSVRATHALPFDPAAKFARLHPDLKPIAEELFRGERISQEIPPPPPVANSLEGARYRDQLSKIGQTRIDPSYANAVCDAIVESLSSLDDYIGSKGDTTVPIRHLIPELNRAVVRLIDPLLDANVKGAMARIDENYNKTAKRNSEPIHPSAYTGEDVVEVYLKGAPLIDAFNIRVPFGIPETTRFEHHHIIAGTGHGKTQTIQHLISRDLTELGAKSIVVIDSQGDLIKNILALPLDPNDVVLIDPTDVEYPVCLNLFSVGQERLGGYSLLDRERLINSVIELYDFVLGSLLDASMTSKQSVIFRYVTRLMILIPNASIHTFREVLEDSKPFQEYINRLTGTPRNFFDREYNGTEYKKTRQEVLRRLYGILENQTFERMFTNPVSKVDIFKAMGEGKLILINTAKDLLKEGGTQIFGRFFIALIAQAAQERATQSYRMPAIVYIDEAQEYFDQNIGIILSQARKYGVGTVLAHQYLSQMDNKLQEAVDANTSIKMAGGLSVKDARSMAQSLHCEADFIQSQPKGTFATHIRGHTARAVPLSFPFGTLERMPKATTEERDRFRSIMRERYASPLAPDKEQEPSPNQPPPTDPDNVPEAGEW